MSDIDGWLSSAAFGYSNLSAEEKSVIRDFALVWSFFEAQKLNCSANHSKIDCWAREHKGSHELFVPELQYFRERYVTGDTINTRFEGLKFQNEATKKVVESVLLQNPLEPSLKTAALFHIIFRLRNNLFHGEKWAYGIRDQLENFSNANSAIMKSF